MTLEGDIAQLVTLVNTMVSSVDSRFNGILSEIKKATELSSFDLIVSTKLPETETTFQSIAKALAKIAANRALNIPDNGYTILVKSYTDSGTIIIDQPTIELFFNIQKEKKLDATAPFLNVVTDDVTIKGGFYSFATAPLTGASAAQSPKFIISSGKHTVLRGAKIINIESQSFVNVTLAQDNFKTTF